MGTQKAIVSDTHLDWMNSGPPTRVLHRKMILFLCFCWASLCGFFGFLSRYFFRFQFRNSVEKESFDGIQAPEAIDFPSEDDGSRERDSSSSFSFKFQFQSREEILRLAEELEARPDEEKKFTSTAAEIHDDGFAGFNEEPEVMSFSIKEWFPDSEGDTPSSGAKNNTPDVIEFEDEFLLERDSKQEKSAMEEGNRTEQSDTLVSNSVVEDRTTGEINVASEKEFPGFDSDPESISLSDGLSVMNQITESERNDFPSDIDLGRFRSRAELQEGMQNSEVRRWWESFASDTDSVGFSEEFSPVDHPIDIYKLYVSDSEFSERSSSVLNRLDDSALSSEFLSEKDFLGSDIDSEDFEAEIEEFRDELEELEQTQLENSEVPAEEVESGESFLSEEDFGASESELKDELCELAEAQAEELTDSDSEEEDELEYLWEHQNLIEQLRMEMKKVRETGLPTILEEEAEDVKMFDDLKPWKMDEKFLQEDPLDEMQKFYKSYRERMRKLDILNYQKMYAIGFLRLKDPLESISTSRKASSPKLSFLLSHNLLRRNHRKRSEADPTAKFIQELQSDLETVYVGQTCLSWEFLHWQYHKSHQLSQSDPHSCRQYNRTAGEFQQFQVLLQRFLENEPFQGPRLQTYVKTRCVLKNLLQVPEIKEDCLKERMAERKQGKEAITSEMLLNIINESMRIFWQFVKADKQETNAILKASSRSKTQLEDPADSQLFEDVQAQLLKRAKKLKDLLRSGNCLVKKFQKPREEDLSTHKVYFFSQVDLRLVSRVLRMSRITTDQLLWCHKKLNKLAFHDRKLYREPTFLPFPCC